MNFDQLPPSTRSRPVEERVIARCLHMAFYLSHTSRSRRQLSEMYGVSERTITKDLQRLRGAGVRISHDRAAGYRVYLDAWLKSE